MQRAGSERSGTRRRLPASLPASLPAIGALAFAWASGGWLLAGAAREAALPWAPPLFHLSALAAAALLALAILRDEERAAGRAARARRAALDAALGELGAGDLPRAAAVALPSEVAPAFARALAGIGGRVAQLQESSLAVAGAAESVDQNLGALATGASQQAAAAGEVTAAMEELARTAAQIAEHADRQGALVAQAEGDGTAGAEALAEATAGVGAVEARIAEITSRADTIGSRAREIFRVLELINEIAQETHLLSLNAALEGAAAGDRGRRFAVVAGEVRVLAGRVRDSVAAVRSQVEEFASSIRATVVATEEGSKEAARVLEETRAAGAALDVLRAALAESSTAARQIASVTHQQTAASEEVLSTLRELNQVVGRMSRDLGDLARTARRLRDVGLDLQLQAQAFRLDSARSLKHRVEEWSRQLAAAADPVAALAGLVAAAPFVELGYLVDGAGRLVAVQVGAAYAEEAAATTEALRRLDLREREWFRAAADAGRAVVMPPSRSLLSGDLCLTVAVPQMDAGDRAPRAVVGLDVSLRHWTEIGR